MPFVRCLISGLTILLLLSVGPQAAAQAPAGRSDEKKLAAGISIGQVGDDPSISLELLTPTLLTKNLRAHIRLSRTWLEAYKATCDHSAAYSTASTGLIFTMRLSNQVRGTVETGSFVVAGNAKFSKRHLWSGYYAACGVELYSLDVKQSHFGFIMSAGYASSRARAGKLEGQPTYGGGVFFRGGLRYYF
jgi:hypothetical protein